MVAQQVKLPLVRVRFAQNFHTTPRIRRRAPRKSAAFVIGIPRYSKAVTRTSLCVSVRRSRESRLKAHIAYNSRSLFALRSLAPRVHERSRKSAITLCHRLLAYTRRGRNGISAVMPSFTCHLASGECSATEGRPHGSHRTCFHSIAHFFYQFRA